MKLKFKAEENRIVDQQIAFPTFIFGCKVSLGGFRGLLRRRSQKIPTYAPFTPRELPKYQMTFN
ncbi:hypothetical protein Avbf_02592 [Armadillidium vulgare]|nr:hypothetical protein Avbf_02592 [Armadillidium vulgare]